MKAKRSSPYREASGLAALYGLAVSCLQDLPVNQYQHHMFAIPTPPHCLGLAAVHTCHVDRERREGIKH